MIFRPKSHHVWLKEVIEGLVHSEFPTSWNLIIPPGFDEDQIADELLITLRAHSSQPRVCLVSAANLKDGRDYVSCLHSHWSHNLDLAIPDPDIEANINLAKLINSIPHEVIAIQIITRFQKVLDTLDQYFLGTLRVAEQSHKIRTITVAPYSYTELKKRWQAQSHFFCNSDYGDTHQRKMVTLPNREESLKYALACGVSRAIAEFFYDLTGGYPECTAMVMNDWCRLDKPSLKPEVRKRLTQTAQFSLERFIEWMDATKDMRITKAVINLYYGLDSDDALFQLSNHPWSPLLIEDRSIRSEAVVSAATTHLCNGTGLINEEVRLRNIWEYSITLYSNGHYCDAVQFLKRVPQGSMRTYLSLFCFHANIMALLYSDKESPFGIDTDWKALRKFIGEARTILNSSSLIEGEKRILLLQRYKEVEEFASSIINATNRNSRVIDSLAGMNGSDVANIQSAGLLMLIAYRIGVRAPGKSSGWRQALPLLEQTFRVWAFVVLSIDYYKAPSAPEEVWEIVQSQFSTSLKRPAIGDRFSSFECFAYFCVVCHLKAGNNPDLAPESDLKMLERSLSLLNFRNENSHALAIPNESLRLKYFDLIEKWLDVFVEACLPHTSKEELFAIIEPLPLIQPNGDFNWGKK